MKIIIADDEKLVRSTLKSMLQELTEKDLPIQLIGEAKNGQELIELLRTDTPDLVFVDIRMPKMDGIEAIQIGKTLAPNASWIILSGFMEFKYAQKAIRLGASDYLLKPADPEQLEKCIRQAIEEREQNAQLRNYQFEHWLSASYREIQAGTLRDDYACSSYCFFGILLYSVHRSKPSAYHLNRLASTIQQAVDRYGPVGDLRYASLQMRGEDLSCIWAWPALGDTENDEVKQKLQQHITDALRREQESSFPLTILQSETCHTVRDLWDQMDELHAYSSLRVRLPLNKLYTLTQLRKEAAKEENVALSKSILQIVNLYQDQDYVGYQNKLSAFGKEYMSYLREEMDCFQQITSFLKAALCPDLHTDLEPGQWIETLQNQGEQLLLQNGKSSGSSGDLVQRVIDYVNEHYQYDISIGSLAEIGRAHV